MYSRTPDIWPDNWTVNIFPWKSVHTLTIVRNTSLPPLGSQSLFTTVSARNSPFCACHNWWAWITIAADDAWRHRYLRISRHVLNCCVWIIPVFSCKYSCYTIRKRGFSVLWLSSFFVLQPRSNPVRVRYKGWYRILTTHKIIKNCWKIQILQSFQDTM